MKEMIIHEDLRRKWKENLKPIYSIKQDFQILVRTAGVCTETADIPFRNVTCRNSSKITNSSEIFTHATPVIMQSKIIYYKSGVKW